MSSGGAHENIFLCKLVIHDMLRLGIEMQKVGFWIMG